LDVFNWELKRIFFRKATFDIPKADIKNCFFWVLSTVGQSVGS